jgi:hypothetical protein
VLYLSYFQPDHSARFGLAKAKSDNAPESYNGNPQQGLLHALPLCPGPHAGTHSTGATRNGARPMIKYP